MVAFIIFFIGIVIYIISRNNARDKQQDYKHTPFYKQLSYDDKLRMEIVLALENQVKNAFLLSNNPFEQGLYVSAAIADKKNMLLQNKVQISNQSKVPLYLVIEIIDECCLGAYTTYIKQ